MKWSWEYFCHNDTCDLMLLMMSIISSLGSSYIDACIICYCRCVYLLIFCFRQNESILGSSIKIDLNQISQPSKGKVTARPAPRDSSVLIHRHSTPINRTLNNSYARQQLAAKAKKEAELSTIICDNTSNKGNSRCTCNDVNAIQFLFNQSCYCSSLQ